MEKQLNIVPCTICGTKLNDALTKFLTFGDALGTKIPLCSRCTQNLRNYLLNEREKYLNKN